MQRSLQRQIDLLEEEARSRIDGQEDRARDLALQRAELQRNVDEALAARERELIDVIGLRADVATREQGRQIQAASQLFGLEDLERSIRVNQAQTLAALEQSVIDRENARLDQILQLQSIAPDMGRQALSDALAVLGMGSLSPASSNVLQTLLGIGQANVTQQQQTNNWLAQLGQALGGMGFGGFGFGAQSGAQ